MAWLLITILMWPQRVRDHQQWSTVDHAPSEYQPRDPFQRSPVPYRVLIGENGAFCVVSAQDYVQTANGNLFDCRWQGPWKR